MVFLNIDMLNNHLVDEIFHIMNKYPGEKTFEIAYFDTGRKYKINMYSTDIKVEINKDLIDELNFIGIKHQVKCTPF